VSYTSICVQPKHEQEKKCLHTNAHLDTYKTWYKSSGKGFNRLLDLKIQHRVFVEALSPITNNTKKSINQEQGMCSQMHIKLNF